MWYKNECTKVMFVLATLALAGLAHGAVLDVCPTCTHTTLDSAFAAAGTDDTIILDGPDAVTDPAVTYTLTADLVIDDTKDGLDIRGQSTSFPHKIQVVGLGTGPIITVEEDIEFKMRGFTLMGGTTGLLAMKNSNVDIRRMLFDGIAGVSVDCVEPEEVYMAACVIANGTDDAVKIDMGGELNITQCTFINNTGLGVNAVAGMATIEATLIYDCSTGLDDGTGTALTVGGNWVTDSAGNAIAMPGGATDTYEVTDFLDPAVVFDAGVDAFPGEMAAVTEVRRTGQDSATLSSVDFFSRDFGNLGRSATDLAVGADEHTTDVSAAAWTECYVVQRGIPRHWIGEGPVTINIVTPNIDLTNAVLWISNPTEQGVPIDLTLERIGPLAVTTPSVVDNNFGFVDYTVDRDVFATTFAATIPNVDVDFYEIFIHTTGGIPSAVDPDFLDGTATIDSQAQIGRIFGLDTEPPTIVTNFLQLADQYLSSPADGGGVDPGPIPPWGGVPFALLGNVGANAGYFNGLTGDPQVFFDGTLTAGIPDPLSFGLQLTFDDSGSGFETAGLPAGRVAITPAEKDAALYRDYNPDFRGGPGMPWWDFNSESQLELITGPPQLTVTYASTGTQLVATWQFDGAIYDAANLTQWHAIANIRVTDLAGNEATLDPSFETFIPLKPFHFWWLPIARGQLRGGPGDVTNPVFTWGMNRFTGGSDPKDTNPCFATVRWRLWAAVSPGLPGTAWAPPPGFDAWSLWMNPTVKTITLDTIHSGNTRLRDLLTAGNGAEYLIAVQGYDEAGNLQFDPGLNGGLASIGVLQGNSIDHRRWIDTGISDSLGLETRVTPVFWHNRAGLNQRAPDQGERVFGAAPRIPLPSEDVCERVEAGFTITLEVSDADFTGSNVGAYFELSEDGRLAASGVVARTGTSSTVTLVIPEDLINPPANLALSATPPPLSFLNLSPDYCGPVQDRLGDDGNPGTESIFRKRDVKYQLTAATALLDASGNLVPDPAAPTTSIMDRSPATVEFVVTVDRGLKDDQPIKTFTKE